MSYGGIDFVEVDEEYDTFYVHREEGDYYNSYSISEESGFLAWVLEHDIEIFDLGR